MNFGIVFEAVAETSGASIDEVKFQLLNFQSYEIVKRM